MSPVSSSEAEADAFEDSCVANPEFARQVELEQRLKAGLAQVARGSTSEFVRSDDDPSAGAWPLPPACWRSCSRRLICGSACRARSHTSWPRSRGDAAAQRRRRCGSRWCAARRICRSCRAARCAWKSSACSIRAFTTVSRSIACGPEKDAETVATLYGQHPSSPVTLEVMLDSEQLDAGAYSLRVLKQASDEEPLDFGFVKFVVSPRRRSTSPRALATLGSQGNSGEFRVSTRASLHFIHTGPPGLRVV